MGWLRKELKQKQRDAKKHAHIKRALIRKQKLLAKVLRSNDDK